MREGRQPPDLDPAPTVRREDDRRSFGAVVDASSLKPGRFEATAWVDQQETVRQQVTLDKD